MVSFFPPDTCWNRESRHPSYPHIPRRWRERRPTGLEPSRPGYSWANEVSGAALPWEVGGGGVGKRLLKTSSPLFPLLSPKAQAESAHCPRAVVSFRGSFCKGAGLHGRSRTSLVGWG